MVHVFVKCGREEEVVEISGRMGRKRSRKIQTDVKFSCGG